ncbi:hypothetical protein LPJ75_005917 [Coemansia sp. RSA 2598]|nr:hypothetical protein LPJ75_005917 [Coemansia sp. RSA 2598]
MAHHTRKAGLQVMAPKTASSEDASVHTDPSVYAYDEVYDEISSARSRIKTQRMKSDDMRPKYMEKLIASAKQRQVQKEVVRERLLTKERQREGEKFADKEVIVTDGYRRQKEMRQKMVEEEEVREQQEADRGRGKSEGGLGAARFYRGILDHVDREDVSKAVAKNGSSLGSAETGGLKQQQQQKQGMPAGENEDRLPLRAGLNVSSRSRHRQRDSRHDDKDVDSAATDDADSHRSASARRPLPRGGGSGWSLSRDVAEQKRMLEQAKEQERQELIRKYARRNDRASIEAARERYLQRKQGGCVR